MLLLKNGNLLVANNQTILKDILIDQNKIINIDTTITEPTAHVIDLKGQLVLPGLVDIHVHFREPGFEHKETIATGSKAAARGGFTTVCAMPNLNPVPDTVEKYQAVLQRINDTACIKVHQYAPITQQLNSDKIVDMTSIDAFAYTNDGVGVQSAGVMYRAMQQAAANQAAIVAHTEDNSLLFSGVMHEGIRNKQLGLPGIVASAEASQIARDVILAYETGVHYHICHVSSHESIAAIKMGKALGANVTSEVTPHHLLLNELDVENDANYKMNPPLRGKQDQQALIDALLDGTIEVIATDHAPHTTDEKEQGFLKAPFGIVGSEFAFALLYTTFVKEKDIFTLQQLQQWLSSKPKQLFNLPAGQLKIGDVADIAVFDLNHPYVIDDKDFQSKSHNSPFLGKTVYGMCRLTMVEGAIVWNVI